jgi:hypothetical protein
MKLVNRLKENAPPSKKLDWIVALLSIWFVGGIYTDGWAHNHLSSSLETFFTPWHALLYSGYFAVALAFAIAWCINYRKGYRMLAALPPGYLLGLIGAKIFFLSGLGDLAWHEIFGIEANVDALLSPTHLGLAIGAALMVSSPLRAYLAKARTKLSFVAAIPLLISMAAFWLVLTFMTQYVNPINQPFMIADKITKDPYFGQTIGLAAILLSAITIIGLLSVVVRRQKLPFGSLVVVFTLNAVGLAFMKDHFMFIPAAAVAGLLADVLTYYAQPFEVKTKAWLTRLWSVAVPVIYFACYYTVVFATNSVWWSVHLWAGSLVMAAVAGWLMSYVAVE